MKTYRALQRDWIVHWNGWSWNRRTVHRKREERPWGDPQTRQIERQEIQSVKETLNGMEGAGQNLECEFDRYWPSYRAPQLTVSYHA